MKHRLLTIAAALLVLAPSTASSADEPIFVDPATSRWQVKHVDGTVDTFYFGLPGDVPLFGLFGAITFLVAMVVGGAAQNWGPLVGAVFFIFVNELARTVGENPSESVFGFLFSEGTKLDGLGGVIFGVLLILFARFAPFGAVGTFRILRGRVVQVIPKPPAGSRAARAADAE